MTAQRYSTITPLRTPAAARESMAAVRIARCVFRRLTVLDTRHGRSYDVECCFPGATAAVLLGDMETATPICNSCTATGRFRADED